MKSRDGQRQREEKSRREQIREEKSQKKEDADARKGRKVTKHCVFPMICGSGGSKGRPAKAASAEPCSQMRRDDKLHTIVARSTFRSKNVQNTRCGAKHTSKSKCAKHYKTHHVRTTLVS